MTSPRPISPAGADFGDNGAAARAHAKSPPAPSADVLVTHTDYDAAGNVLDVIDPTGTQTRFFYDALGRKIKQIDNYTGGDPSNSANITTAFTYDGNDNLLTETAVAPAGLISETTKFIYGAGVNADQVITTENPDPVTGAPSTAANEDTTLTLDNLGNVLSESDPDGTVHTYTYDDLNRVTLDALTALGSDNDGLVRASGYVYAPNGNIFQTTDYSDAAATQIASQTQDVYDGYGNEIGQYDSESGPVDTATTPEETTNITGDEETGDSNPFGATTSNTYQGNTVTQTNQSGHDLAAQYNYDPMTGNLSSLKLYPSGTVGSGSAETTSWDYYAASGQLKQKTYADGTSDYYVYNAKQQLSSLTRPGETINYGYNAAGDQTSTSATDSITGTSVGTTNTYDSTTGLLSSVSGTSTSGGSTVTTTNAFTYTSQGNIGSETQVGGVTTQYAYFGDGANNPGALKSMKLVQNGTVISETDYTYDSKQRLSAITINGEQITFGYQSGKNVLSSITSGAVSTLFTVDPNTGNLTGISAGTSDSPNLYSATYGYNANNQRTTQTVSQTNVDGSTSLPNYNYGYDGENHLAAVTDTASGSALDNFTYDSAGNRTDGAFESQFGTANAMNEYSRISYNSRGDVTDDGTFAYTWNATDQMTSATADDNSIRVTFQWDGEGRMIQKDAYSWNAQGNGAWELAYTRKYVYDGTQLIEELDGGNNPVSGYTYGPNGLDVVTDFTGASPKEYVAILDGTGNVMGLIDATTGEVAATYTYTPFQAPLTATGPAAGVCSLRGAQGLACAEAKLTFFGVREESWAGGFWLSPDPSGIAGGLNTSIFCNDDPINFTDASGFAPVELDWTTPYGDINTNHWTIKGGWGVTGEQSNPAFIVRMRDQALAKSAYFTQAGDPGNAALAYTQAAIWNSYLPPNERSLALPTPPPPAPAPAAGFSLIKSGNALRTATENQLQVANEGGDNDAAQQERINAAVDFSRDANKVLEGEVAVAGMFLPGPEEALAGAVATKLAEKGISMVFRGGKWLFSRKGKLLAKEAEQEAVQLAQQIYKEERAAAKGGEYRTVRAANDGGQVHHSPAAKVTPYSYRDAPAFWMETADHMKTASWGRSSGAVAYRKQQADLISRGELRRAIQMDIDDIRAKFGSKYDANIREMLKSFGFSE